MKKNLSRHVDNIQVDNRLRGDVTNITGDVSNLRGNVSNITGDVSNLRGDVTGLQGLAIGISGNLDDCDITYADRHAQIDINTLVRP